MMKPAIAIAIKPVGKGPGVDSPDLGGADDGGEMGGDSQVGMDIVDQCKQLDPADVQTLVHGISPEAIEVMEQIPELKPFANYIEHGSPEEEPVENPPGNTGPMNRRDSIRSSIADAMGQNGMKGGY